MVAKNIQTRVFCFSDLVNISFECLIFYRFFFFSANNDSSPKHKHIFFRFSVSEFTCQWITPIDKNHNFKDFAIKD